MKPTTNSKSSNNSSGAKPKKSNKEREKRKSQTGNDKYDSEKGSPIKDGSARKFAGIGPDSIIIYSEQSSFEHLSEDLYYGFAEDLSYKLRFVIHDALIKARLSGRNYILSTDIDSTFKNINIEKVYGATSTPNYIPFGDQTLLYLDDPIINLVELSEEANSFNQPGDLIITRLWLPEPKDVGKALKKYFETICFAIVSNDKEIQLAALHDISKNTLIGPIIQWFYQFSYYLLSKDITYDCLTLITLDLIRALEENPVAAQIVSEKQLKLLVRLILQRLLHSAITLDAAKPMCEVLTILCDRLAIKEMVTIKLSQKLFEIENGFALPIIISIINGLGAETINDLLEPHIDYVLNRITEVNESDLIFSLLRTYYIVRNENSFIINNKIYDFYGALLLPTWKMRPLMLKIEKPEINRKNISLQLLKTKRKVAHVNSPKKKWTLHEVFPDDLESETKPKIIIKFRTFTPTKGRERFLDASKRFDKKQEHFLSIGQRTILISVLNNYKRKIDLFQKCCDHSLLHLL